MSNKQLYYGMVIAFCVTALLVLCAGLMGYLSFGSSVSHPAPGVYRPTIAILLPVSHPSLEQIARGFRETLSKTTDCDPIYLEYNANGNKSLLHSYTEDALSRQVDLIFAVATSPASFAKESTAKKGLTTPIVFGGVTDPIAAGIIASESSSGNNCTGIIDTIDHARQLDVLKLLRPDLKSILLVYDPSAAGLESLRGEIEKLAQSRAITMKAVGIYRVAELAAKLAPSLGATDAVLVLKDNTIVSGIETLIKLCEQYGVTLCVSDLDSVDKGAAFGFGVREYDMGVSSAEKAREILVDKKAPQDIPSERASAYRIKVNRVHAPRQGLNVPSQTLMLMEYGDVVPKS